MTISWPNLAIGFVVGLILGAIADWQIGSRFRKWSELRALNKEYGSLAGQYDRTASGMTAPTSRRAR